jgi:hypothetical protein
MVSPNSAVDQVETLLRSRFSKKSTEANALNALLDGLDREQATAALTRYIQNRTMIERSMTGAIVGPEMPNGRWSELVEKHGLIFNAVIATAFQGNPPASTVSAKFLEFRNQYSGEERDVLVGLLISDWRVPYPDLPPVDSLKTVSKERFSAIVASSRREIRMIDYMIKAPEYDDFQQVAIVLSRILDGLQEGDERWVLISICFSMIQSYVVDQAQAT